MRWYSCLVSVLSGALLGFFATASSSAQSVEAGFSREKTDYLVGEPVFVSLPISNKTSEPLWLEFEARNIFACGDFTIEVPGAGPAEEAWGSGSLEVAVAACAKSRPARAQFSASW